MAGRPPKESIDYAGWDVNIFDNEPKIDKLMEAQGCIGFTIYFYLCQKAYGSYGYFYPWCFDDSATTARKIGGGASANSVEETVKLCLRVGLLNEELYDRWQILTSRGIQKRYMQVAAARTNKSVISEYWCLSDEESPGLVKVTINPGEKRIMTPHNSIMTPHNTHFSGSKVKDSKVEDSIGKESTYTADDAADAAPKSRRKKASSLTKKQAEQFTRFWAVYPRKVKKDEAEKAWAKIDPDEELADKIISAVFTAKSADTRFRETQYTPHPASWLNGREWLNEYESPQQQGGSGLGTDRRNSRSGGGNPFLDIAKERGYIGDD